MSRDARGSLPLIGTRLASTRYDEIAAAFGCHAARVTEASELQGAIRAAFASGRPACINVLVSLDPAPPELELLARR
jgi:acetolactate synthase-1/2/3 large subunit